MLDHSTREIASGSKLGIDAKKKLPSEDFKRPWPPLGLFPICRGADLGLIVAIPLGLFVARTRFDFVTLPRLRGIQESERDSVPKPRVARHELPWVTVPPTFPTAKRLRVLADGHRSVPARRATFATTALRLMTCFTMTQGRRGAPTLGWRPMPL